MTDPTPTDPGADGEPDPSSTAEEILAEHLAATAAGDPHGLEALLERHPEHAETLRSLHDSWMRVHDALRRCAGTDATLEATRPAAPPVPAAAAAPRDSASSSLLRRLGQRSRMTAGDERYTVREEVARGAMGAVLKVWDETLQRELAMKVALVSPPDPSGGDSEAEGRLARFLEEAQVTGQLDHPGVLPVHELGLDEQGRAWFTMRLVRGRDLHDVFELVREGREGWTRTRTLGVLQKVCEAMAYAHSKGVIHRDLKPRNVMVGRFGEVYVVDWGLARVIGREDRADIRLQEAVDTLSMHTVREEDRRAAPDSPLLTMDGTVMGTPAYMPPEQARGEIESVGRRSDVYAVGAMLYELLAGHMPYVEPGARVGPHTVLAAVLAGPPPPVSAVCEGVPPELEAICQKAMAREPDDRYAGMLELAEDLRAYLEGRVVAAYETGAWPEARKWVQRNRPLAASLAAGFLILVAGLAAVSVVQAGRTRLARANAEESRRVLRLSAFRTLEDLEQRARELWPAHPEMRGAYREWLADAEALIGGLGPDAETGDPGHLQQLANLRARALPGSSDASGWRFEDPEDRWWHDQLERLIAEIEAFAALHVSPDSPLSPEVGWGVARRLAFAETIEERSLTGAEPARRWAEARAAIAADPRYAGLDLAPQLGLVPIGADPRSGLQEFWHVQTGDEPLRDADGDLVRTPAMGLVFVLLPRGTFWMGAQADDPEGPNHDPQASPNEGPVHLVALSPCFVSKDEMTQGQWARFAGSNPSGYTAGDHGPRMNDRGLDFSALHPVENLSWLECERVTRDLALALPTEAQWEYAARAGTDTPWWVGDDPAHLADAANLADAWADAQSRSLVCESWSDGFFWTSPAGTFRANAFGLHDVHGNVWEWCLDGGDDSGYPSDEPRVDPLVDPRDAEQRVGRGGGYDDLAVLARSSERGSGWPDYRSPRMGLRPARAIESAREGER